MKNSIYICLSCIFILVLSSCATPKRVFTDQDPKQDFSAYSTFSWAFKNPMIVDSDKQYKVPELTRLRVIQSVKSTLSEKGYTFIENKNPDFSVLFTIGARDKSVMNIRDNVIYTPPSHSNNWGSQYYMPQVVMSNYTKGTLSIDVYDTKSNRPVWHGRGSKELSPTDLRNPLSGVNSGVRKILADFPAR